MIFPIENFDWNTVSQLFGVNSQTYQRRFGIPAHPGIDIVKEYGTHIVAAHDGIVGAVVFDDAPLHTRGNGIYLNSLDGKFATVYWHLSSVLVSIGQKVKAGDVIGLMGNSGYVLPVPTEEKPKSGTHLHFAKLIYGKQNRYKGFVDPLPDLYKQGEFSV